MGELKPCPFCPDGKGELCAELKLDVGNRYSGYSVRCRSCFAKTGIYTSEQEAIHAWNRRVALETDNTEVLEAYRGLLQKSQELSQTLLEKLEMMEEGENKPLTIRELRELAEADETVYEADGTQWGLYPGDNNQIRALYTTASGGKCDVIVDEYKIANGFFLYASKPEGSGKA